EQGQEDTEPDPVQRDGPGLRIAQKKEERWSRDASENAPPAVIFDEEIAEMADRDRDDCHGFQPVGVVNGARRLRVSKRCARRMHGVYAPLRPALSSFSGTRRQLMIEPASHVKSAPTLPQPFL